MHILYRLKFANGKSYIGQTTRTLHLRVLQHARSVRGGSQLPVHCAWRALGKPVAEVIGEFEDQDELHAAEVAAIRDENTFCPHGYNLSIGGDTAPSKSAEVAKKISEKAKGRKHSKETTAVMSAGLKERWKDPEYREKVLSNQGAGYTDEVRKRMSEKAKARWQRQKEAGFKVSEETKAKLRAKVVSDETRQKMSASAKGKVISEETRLKMSAANKGRKYGPTSEEKKAAIGASIKAAWQDPEKRERLMAARKRAWETRRART